MAWETWSRDRQYGIDTLIGRGCRIVGKVVFQGGLRVDGQIIGDVQADPVGAGYLILPAEGRIEGDIRVSAMVVGGEVLGNLHVTGRVELLARARIIGDISYTSIKMRAGCSVTGQLRPFNDLNVPDAHASLPAAQGPEGYNRNILIFKAGAFT
jgi:cytoskeletal protein CcmA (bactofilin family)